MSLLMSHYTLLGHGVEYILLNSLTDLGDVDGSWRGGPIRHTVAIVTVGNHCTVLLGWLAGGGGITFILEYTQFKI